MFGRVKLVRHAIKSKFTYNGCRIAFDGEGSWSFDDDFAKMFFFSVLIIVHPSSHTDNQKNNFLTLGEGPTDGINDSTGAAEKNKY